MLAQPETKIAEIIAHHVQQNLGNHLQKVILFGSFARGDYDAESDVDVMVLSGGEDLKEEQKALDKIADALSLENDRTVSILLKSGADFETRAQHVPFYRNVAAEGVVLYAA